MKRTSDMGRQNSECRMQNKIPATNFRILHSEFCALHSNLSSAHKPTIHHLSAAPVVEAELLPPGIDDHRDLPGLGEEVFVNEQVVARQEDPEARVRVLPADERVLQEGGFALAGQPLPGVVRERE